MVPPSVTVREDLSGRVNVLGSTGPSVMRWDRKGRTEVRRRMWVAPVSARRGE